MGKVSFKYGTASQLANAPYLEGTFYVISDNESTDGILYADLNNKRICFGDVASLIEDVSDLESSIPTKVSELTNDSGFISSYTETDPTVSAWAKAATKPTYTAAEVGAVPTRVATVTSTGSISNSAGSIILNEISSDTQQGYLSLQGSKVSLQARTTNSSTTADSQITLSTTSNTDDIILKNGTTTIHNVVTPTADGDAANKAYVDNSVSDKMTSSQVNSAIASAIGNINQFNVAIVSTLPTENIDTYTIYFMSNGESDNNNIYDEWMYINNSWEKIGTTAVDLSNYVQSTYYENGIAAKIANKTGAVLMGVWNENNNKSGMFEIQSDGIAQITSSNFLQIYGSGQNVQINNLVTPTSNYMAANKKYVDDTVAGITIPTVPTTVSSFTNDAGYLTTTTLPIYDGTVV